MPQTAPKHASYADLLALPGHLVGEIIDGELHTHPRPGPRHAWACSVLGGKLGDAYGWGTGGPGGWWIIDEPELHLKNDIVVPDLAGWRRERMPELPETAWFELAPDWICEILSPATARADRAIKMPLYAREGIPYFWLVDPVLRTLEGYRLVEGHWILLATLKDTDPVRLPPFDGTEFSLGSLWG